MKNIILSIVLILILLIVGGGLWIYSAFIRTVPLTPTEQTTLTPDWAVMTQGNWSPWHTYSDPASSTPVTEWNPAASFNDYLQTIPVEDKAWPILLQMHYSDSDLATHKEIGLFPEDTDNWTLLVEICHQDESTILIEQLKDAMRKPHLGAKLYDSYIPNENAIDIQSASPHPNATRDPLEFAVMETKGLADVQFITNTKHNIDLMTAALPALGKHRQLANITRTYSIYQLELGNPQSINAFVELMILQLNASQLANEFPALISQLVALSIESHAIQTIQWALDRHCDKFTDAQLIALDHALKPSQSRTLLWQGDALVFHDTIRRMVNEQGKLKPTGLTNYQNNTPDQTSAAFDTPSSLPDLDLHASAQRTLYAYNTVLAQATIDSQPVSQPISNPASDSDLSASTPGPSSVASSVAQVASQEREKLSLMSQLIIDTLSPAFENAVTKFHELQQSCADTRLHIAAHRHALRHELPIECDDIPTHTIDTDLLPTD
tara:strand:+ start:132493 stop:133974 length:1482 start_codon:yes stop_codon:yes gene_type:complete